MGLSLSLISLVIRPQVHSGCSSAESETNEECLTTQSATIEKTGTRAHKSFSGVASGRPLFSTQRERISTLHRCLVQQQAVTSNGNQVGHKRLGKMTHQMFFGRSPRPRDASVCPLDNVGLIGVRPHTPSSTRFNFGETL